MQEIFVLRDNQQTGPFREVDVRAQLASGAINPDTLVWWQGLPEWTPVARTPLAGPPAAGPVAPIPAMAPGFTPVTRTSPLAICSLVMGILALPGLLCLPVLVMLSLGAVVSGHLARSQVRRDPSLGGKNMALAGLLLGYLWIFLAVAAVMATSALIALGNQVKATFNTINVQTEQTTNAPTER